MRAYTFFIILATVITLSACQAFPLLSAGDSGEATVSVSSKTVFAQDITAEDMTELSKLLSSKTKTHHVYRAASGKTCVQLYTPTKAFLACRRHAKTAWHVSPALFKTTTSGENK